MRSSIHAERHTVIERAIMTVSDIQEKRGWTVGRDPPLDLRVPKHDSARVLDSFFYTRTFQTFLPLSLFPSSSSPLSYSSLLLLRHLRSCPPSQVHSLLLASLTTVVILLRLVSHTRSHIVFFFFIFSPIRSARYSFIKRRRSTLSDESDFYTFPSHDQDCVDLGPQEPI